MFKDFFSIQEKPVELMIHLLKILKVNVTESSVAKTLQNHPDYPSLLSFSDSLHSWNIDNMAAQIDKKNLFKLPVPFIAHIRDKQENLALVIEIKNNTVHYIIDDKKLCQSINYFNEIWSGVSLLVEKNNLSGEKNYLVNKRKEVLVSLKMPILVGIILIFSALAVYSFWHSFSSLYKTFDFSILLLLKLLGIFISLLLLWYEIDKTNPVLQKICTAGAKINCSAVLNSKQSKLFSFLSWSDVGFIYFTSGFSVLLIAGVATSISLFSFIATFNLLALPYSVFSIYYQWRIVKQWCVLCLGVQAIFVFEFITSLFNSLFFIESTPLQTFDNALLVLLIMVFVSAILFTMKSLLLKNREAKYSQRELTRLKANPQIWDALLAKQKRIINPANNLGISLGNQLASNTLIKVCNPYCGPCAQAHPEIERLLEENKDLKVQILFTATNDENDIKTLPIKHLLAIAEKGDENLTKKALYDWYLAEKKDYGLFASKYPMNGELNNQEEKINAMASWCEKANITYTPTIFINGHQLPEIYAIPDIHYLL